MKKKIFTLIAIFLWIGSVIQPAFATGNQNLTPNGPTDLIGERPPVQWHNVPADAFETGKFFIKLRSDMEDFFTTDLIESRGIDPVVIGYNAIDALNDRFSVTSYKSMLYGLYEKSPSSADYASRHKQWEFHLWFEVAYESDKEVMEVVEAFNSLPEVEVAEPVLAKRPIEPVMVTPVDEQRDGGQRMTPNDQYYGLQWGFKNTGQDILGVFGTPGADIKAEPAWEYVTGNPEVIVAVIDGGIQYNHPDLAGNIWSGIGPDGTGTTPDDHGTHVAGTVAAMSNNGTGVAGSAGGDGTSNSGVKLMSLDIFGGSHGMNNLQLNIYAADNGAALTQNSWGYMYSGVYNQTDLDGIDYFNAYGGGGILAGGLSIFAAGNDNSSADWYPGYYSGTVAVASSDNQDKKSSFSNYGSWVDLTAPGTDIASTASGSSYVWMSGTSMACPHVSGIAALVLSYAPGVMTNQQLWDLLVSTTDNIDGINPGYLGQLGSGRLNALKAVEAAQAFLGGVERPASLSATTINESEIFLQWQANAANSAVLVAFSQDGVFGEPQNGTTYNAGETIIGGGTVLYFGQTQNTFNHTNLDFATTYYYRAWSYDIEYSGHLAAQATTSCSAGLQLPFTENFDSSSTIPQCWTTEGNYTWNFGTFSEGLIGTTGNYAWVEISGNSAASAALNTPDFNFSDYTDIRLEFKHRYNHNRSSAYIAYSTNGGSSWTTIQTWTGNTGTTVFDQVIGALAGQPSVQFSWVLDFGGGGAPTARKSWSIDDIVVSGTLAGTTYTINATAGNGGSINPSGNISVAEGNNQSFSITPDNGFVISDVLVDNVSIGAVDTYTFYNVISNHSIYATFEEIPVITYNITATAGVGGSISPAGVITVNEGNNQSFSITSNTGYEILDVLVDNVSIGAVGSYTFQNVNAGHTIHATFEEVPIVTHIITSSAGSGGSISPVGNIEVIEGENQSFSIIPDDGFLIAEVLVDGNNVGAVSNFTFSNVIANHTIYAAFETAPEDPCLVTSLPFLETFDAAAVIPECWETNINGGITSWVVGSFSGGLSGTSGNYAYFHYQGNKSQNADLISPSFNFVNYNNISLSFNHYYVNNRSSVGFYYSTDGGNNWIAIQTWTSTTNNPATFSQTIASLAGQPNVKFRWNMDYPGGGSQSTFRSWSIDDFNISGTIAQQSGNISEFIGMSDENQDQVDLKMNCFPNPVSNILYINSNQEVKNGNIIITDLHGRQVYHETVSGLLKDESKSINISNLSSGQYFVKLISENDMVTKIITKR